MRILREDLWRSLIIMRVMKGNDGIKRKNAKLLAIVITSIVINANGTGTATDFNNQDN